MIRQKAKVKDVAQPSPPPHDIRQRTFLFAVRVVKACRRLEKAGASRDLVRQLMRSATSVGANAEEAQAGQSRADFISENAICLKEARESHYWLRLLQAAEVSDDRELPALEQESLELARIFGSIITSAKRNSVR